MSREITIRLEFTCDNVLEAQQFVETAKAEFTVMEEKMHIMLVKSNITEKVEGGYRNIPCKE